MRFLDDYLFDVRTLGDDRPFFFYTVQPRDLWNFLTTMNKDSADYKINRAVPMLFSLVGVSLLATLIILALQVIRRVTGGSVDDALAREVVEPLGLGEMHIGWPADRREERADLLVELSPTARFEAGTHRAERIGKKLACL